MIGLALGGLACIASPCVVVAALVVAVGWIGWRHERDRRLVETSLRDAHGWARGDVDDLDDEPADDD